MKINEIKYEKKFNLGNYESETITVGAAVNDNEDPILVLASLKKFVESRGITASEPVAEEQLELKPLPLEVTEAPVVALEEEKPKKAKKQRLKAAVEPWTEDVAAVEETPDPAPAPAPAPAPKKASKLGTTPYNRDLDIHKKILVSALNDQLGNDWKTKSAKVRDASIKLQGEPFLDKEGLLLQSFMESFISEAFGK